MKKRPETLPPGIFFKPGTGLYYIRYEDAAGRRRQERAGTYRMAEDLLLHRRMERLRRRLPGVRTRFGVKMSELIDDAIAYATANNDPQVAYDMHRKMDRIRSAFGSKDASLVKRADIVAWLDSETVVREWKPASRNKYQSAFSLLFRLGIESGKVEENPASKITRKQEDNGRIRFLSREEEDRLMAAVDKLYPEYRWALTLSLHTGMRLSEQLRAMVGDYDPSTSVLTIHQKKNRKGPTVRYVPLTPIAVEAYTQLSANRKAGDLLCSGEGISNVDYWFAKCVETAGVNDFTWHCNRHTAISRWVMAGVPIAAVAKFAGHSNLQMTLRYSHLAPETNKLAIEKMMTWYEPVSV